MNSNRLCTNIFDSRCSLCSSYFVTVFSTGNYRLSNRWNALFILCINFQQMQEKKNDAQMSPCSMMIDKVQTDSKMCNQCNSLIWHSVFHYSNSLWYSISCEKKNLPYSPFTHKISFIWPAKFMQIVFYSFSMFVVSLMRSYSKRIRPVRYIFMFVYLCIDHLISITNSRHKFKTVRLVPM